MKGSYRVCKSYHRNAFRVLLITGEPLLSIRIMKKETKSMNFRNVYYLEKKRRKLGRNQIHLGLPIEVSLVYKCRIIQDV